MCAKQFYCPLYNGEISQYDCDELCLGVNFNKFVNDGLPPLMSIEYIREKREICIRCQVRQNTNYSSDIEIIKQIKMLEEKYADDIEAIETIQRTKIDIAYVERKIKEGNYEGQTPNQHVMSLERHLQMWH